MQQKQGEMATLDSNLETLNEFKDTKQIRAETLAKEREKYKRLKQQLDELKRNGKEEMELQQKKIEDFYE